jgi:hypothetical protein
MGDAMPHRCKKIGDTMQQHDKKIGDAMQQHDKKIGDTMLHRVPHFLKQASREDGRAAAPLAVDDEFRTCK